MKPRQPTEEELLLWHEATKHDRKHRPQPLPEIKTPPPAAAATKKPAMPAPPAKPAALPPLAPLSSREAKRLLKAHPRIEAGIDLHGMSRTEAYAALVRFIEASRRAGRRHLLVVTGKGRAREGVIRAALPGWLAEPPLRAAVVAIARARPEKGGEGALHVLIRKL